MGNSIAPEQANDPTFKKYHLKCMVKFFKKTVRDDLGTRGVIAYDRTMVLLVPQESDEMVRFLNAWCPTTIGEHFELAGHIGGPVHSTCRFSIFMGHDEKCDRPYLFCMSKGVEDIIVKFGKEGMNVQVTTLPANQDSEADFAQDASDGNYQVSE